jgi:hypothetical protein
MDGTVEMKNSHWSPFLLYGLIAESHHPSFLLAFHRAKMTTRLSLTANRGERRGRITSSFSWPPIDTQIPWLSCILLSCLSEHRTQQFSFKTVASAACPETSALNSLTDDRLLPFILNCFTWLKPCDYFMRLIIIIYITVLKQKLSEIIKCPKMLTLLGNRSEILNESFWKWDTFFQLNILYLT